MKTLIAFLTLAMGLSVSSSGQTKYWEDLSCFQKSEILASCKSIAIKKFYNMEIVPTSDDKTWKLLNQLVSSNDTILPLAFYLFNKICIESDGALSEMVEEVCAKFLAKHPQYILTFFSRERSSGVDNPVWKRYSSFIGEELSLKMYGSSSLPYNYQTYKKMLVTASIGNKENEETFKIFWQLVDETIKNLEH